MCQIGLKWRSDLKLSYLAVFIVYPFKSDSMDHAMLLNKVSVWSDTVVYLLV